LIIELYELLMEQLRLVQTGLDVSLYGGLFVILLWQMVVIELAAILAMGTPTGIGACVGGLPVRRDVS
jgi:hypothetical protein